MLAATPLATDIAVTKPAKPAPWKKPNPKRKSTPLNEAQKAAARTRADEAGRRYPNLVDNMWAAKHARGKTESSKEP